MQNHRPVQRRRHRIPPAGSSCGGTALVGFRRVVAALIVADACCILAGLLLVHAGEITRDLVAVMLVAPIIWVFVFHSFDLYGVRHLSPQEEFRRLISATALAVVLITVGSVWWDQGLDRSALVVTWLIALVLELSVRRLARWHIRAQKRSGHLALRTLIVGTNDEAEEMAESLALPVRGFVPLGFISSSLSHEGAGSVARPWVHRTISSTPSARCRRSAYSSLRALRPQMTCSRSPSSVEKRMSRCVCPRILLRC